MSVAASDETIFFAYWVGKLPEVSELHFRSFRKLNPHLRYVLCLENSSSFSTYVGSRMLKVLEECNIEIRSYSLEREMNLLDIPGIAPSIPSIFQRLGRRALGSLASLMRNSAIPSRIGQFHSEELGWSLWHKSRFSHLTSNLAYRSDLFRSVELSKAINYNFVYTDLDICFNLPLAQLPLECSFTSQWGTATFANTAFMYVRKDNSPAREFVLKDVQSGKPPLPWILFTEEFCKKINLNIFPIQYFDPAWSKNSAISGKSELFFLSGPHVHPFLVEVEMQSWMIHWHNQWESSPAEDSPYATLMQRFQHPN